MLLPLKVVFFPVFSLDCYKCNLVINRFMHWLQSPAGLRKEKEFPLCWSKISTPLSLEGETSWQFLMNYKNFKCFQKLGFVQTTHQAQTRWDCTLHMLVQEHNALQKPTWSFRERITCTSDVSARVSLGGQPRLQVSWQLSEGVNTNIFILSHRKKWRSLLES